MAEHSKYFCNVCKKEYHFLSKYERHLSSASHRRVEEIFSISPDDTTCSVAVQTSPTHYFGIDVSRLSRTLCM